MEKVKDEAKVKEEKARKLREESLLAVEPEFILDEMMEEKANEGPPPNRAQRRAQKRKKGGASKSKGGFGK